jgi:hypothetical protein
MFSLETESKTNCALKCLDFFFYFTGTVSLFSLAGALGPTMGYQCLDLILDIMQTISPTKLIAPFTLEMPTALRTLAPFFIRPLFVESFRTMERARFVNCFPPLHFHQFLTIQVIPNASRAQLMFTDGDYYFADSIYGAAIVGDLNVNCNCGQWAVNTWRTVNASTDCTAPPPSASLLCLVSIVSPSGLTSSFLLIFPSNFTFISDTPRCC